MPKRVGDPKVYEFIARKFKKLERKYAKQRNQPQNLLGQQRRLSTSSDSISSSSSENSSDSSEPEGETAPPAPPSQETPNSRDVPTSVNQTTPIAPSSKLPDNQPNILTVSLDSTGLPNATVDEDIIQILGDDPSVTKQFGKDIHTDLALRLQHIATSGLSKEARKELFEKYLPPANCTLLDAPALNPEVKGAISDVVLKRDKGIEGKQKQLCAAISCLAQAMTQLLAAEQRDTTTIQFLLDAQKLLCDTQYSDSVVRRNFVMFSINKELKDQLQATKIDKMLFSEELAETIKTAKAIAKSSTELKPTAPTKAATNKNAKQGGNLNWKAPSHYRQKGNQRRKEPAHQHQRSRRDSSSKQFYQQQPTKNRRR